MLALFLERGGDRAKTMPLHRLIVVSICGCLSAIPSRSAATAPTKIVAIPVVPLRFGDGALPPDDVVGRLNEALSQAVAQSLFESVPLAPSARRVPLGLPDDLATQVDTAKAASRAMDHPTVVRSLAAVAAALEARLLEAGSVEPLLAVYTELAMTYLRMEEPALASGELAKVVRLRPGMDMDPRTVSPKLIAAFNEAKTRTLAEPRGEVRITTTPTGATVWWDDVEMGETPTTIEALNGLHLVEVEADGHAPLLQVIHLAVGGKTNIDAPLEPLPAVTAAGTLIAQLQRRADETQALAACKTLASAVGADAVLVPGLLPINGGYALFVSLTSTPRRSVVGTFATDMARSDAVTRAIVDRLEMMSRTTAPADREVISAAQPKLGIGGVNASDGRYFFGFEPGAPTPPDLEEGGARSTYLRRDAPAKAPSGSLFESPLFWVGLGAAVLTSVVVGYLLYDPGTVTETSPDRVRVTVEEAQ